VLRSKCRNACVLSHIDHDMFLLFFDGMNDRCWIVLAFWDIFNIEIDCSVMRLSCLDELVNNDIIVISVIRVICFSKEGPVFWWNLWLIG
jgi:hypothetical protein